MDIVYRFDIVGGPFDGAPGMSWLDDGKNPPPESIYVGVCRKGLHCGSSSCKRGAVHVSFWMKDEDGRPPDAMPYPKENEFVQTDPESGEMRGRAVYAVGGLRDPRNFGESARQPVEVGGVKSDPLVTASADAYTRELDELWPIIRAAWEGEGR